MFTNAKLCYILRPMQKYWYSMTLESASITATIIAEKCPRRIGGEINEKWLVGL